MARQNQKDRSTYTLRELEAATGFDKRTIAYYISCGVLPKVGRRGPKTTYSSEFADRLALVRRLKNLQDEGHLSALTLRKMAGLISALSTLEVAELAAEHTPDEAVISLFEDAPDDSVESPFAALGDDDPLSWPPERSMASPRLSSAKKRAAGLQHAREQGEEVNYAGKASDPAMGSFGETMHSLQEPDTAPRSPLPDDDDFRQELTRLLTRVDERARTRSSSPPSPSSERLLRVPITDDVLITVRNADAEDAGLVERLAALLRRLTGRGDGG